MSEQTQLAPHSIEAEEAVLGSILLSAESFFEVSSFLTAGDFFLVRHGWIWQAVASLVERREPVDHLTVVGELEQAGKLSEVGGAAYIISLINKTPSSLNVEGYGRIVERMALRRRLIDAAQRVARFAHSDETDIDEVVRQSEQALLAVTDSRRGQTRVRSADVSEVSGEFLSTGMVDVDWITSNQISFGSTLFILAASMQFKTTMACQMASHFALEGHPTLYASLETPLDRIKRKMVSYQAFKNGATYQAAAHDLDQSDLEFVKGRHSVADLAGHVRAMSIACRRPGILFIDTVQKLYDAFGTHGRDQSAMAGASAAVDALKMDSGWLVVELGQQYVETNDRNPISLRPSRNNVKDAKALFEDADIAFGQYWADNWRHEYGKSFQDADCLPGFIEIKCIKNKESNPLKKKMMRVIETVPALVAVQDAPPFVPVPTDAQQQTQGELF